MKDRPQLLELSEEGSSVASLLKGSVSQAEGSLMDDKNKDLPKKPNILRIAPSPLMSRLAAFLPIMRQANEDLTTKDANLYNIETEDIKDGTREQVIEMTFGLGLYEPAGGDGNDTEAARETPLTKLSLPGETKDYKGPLIEEDEAEEREAKVQEAKEEEEPRPVGATELDVKEFIEEYI